MTINICIGKLLNQLILERNHGVVVGKSITSKLEYKLVSHCRFLSAHEDFEFLTFTTYHCKVVSSAAYRRA